MFILDVIAVGLGLTCAWGVWSSTRPGPASVSMLQLWWPNPYMPSGLVLATAWLLVMREVGLYDPFRMTSTTHMLRGVSRASMVLLITAVSLEFMLPEQDYSRSLLLGFCGFTALFLAVLRVVFFRVQSRFPAGFKRRRIAIAGTGAEAQNMAERLGRDARFHYEVAGFLRTSLNPSVAVPTGEILGEVSDIGRLVNEADLHSIVLEPGAISRQEALVLATRADQMGLRVYQVPFTWGIANPRVDLANLGDLHLIDLTTLEYPSLAEQTKRVIDLVLAGIGGLVLLPGLLLVALLIKAQDRGPVLFVQPRAGRGGRKFPFFKFRSMVVGAENLKEQLHNEADGVLFKVTHDPRVTPLGRLLRRSSIDELPQLWNVLVGDMNLVGPRPLPLSDLEDVAKDPEMSYWFELRTKVKPGITGPWQVSGRSDLDMNEMIRHDIHYIQNWSLWLDLVILLRTVPAVLRGRGAR